MYEYEVKTSYVRNAADLMNEMAADGWRVVTVCVNPTGIGLVITFERQRNL